MYSILWLYELFVIGFFNWNGATQKSSVEDTGTYV